MADPGTLWSLFSRGSKLSPTASVVGLLQDYSISCLSIQGQLLKSQKNRVYIGEKDLILLGTEERTSLHLESFTSKWESQEI